MNQDRIVRSKKLMSSDPSNRILMHRHDNSRLHRIWRFDRVVRCERGTGARRPLHVAYPETEQQRFRFPPLRRS
jgi:hypothetical protein